MKKENTAESALREPYIAKSIIDYLNSSEIPSFSRVNKSTNTTLKLLLKRSYQEAEYDFKKLRESKDYDSDTEPSDELLIYRFFKPLREHLAVLDDIEGILTGENELFAAMGRPVKQSAIVAKAINEPRFITYNFVNNHQNKIIVALLSTIITFFLLTTQANEEPNVTMLYILLKLGAFAAKAVYEIPKNHNPYFELFNIHRNKALPGMLFAERLQKNKIKSEVEYEDLRLFFEQAENHCIKGFCP